MSAPPETTDGEVKLTVFIDDDFARIDLIDLDQNLRATGKARRNPIDPPNREVGANLALGRAFASLGRQHLKRAQGLIKHADDMREQRKSQKDKPSYPKPLPSEPAKRFQAGDRVRHDSDLNGHAPGEIICITTWYGLPAAKVDFDRWGVITYPLERLVPDAVHSS